jgi:hypothetical protein
MYYNVTLKRVRVTIAAGKSSKCMSVVLVICEQSGSTKFSHIISLTVRFRGGKKITEHKMCVSIFKKFVSKTFLILRKI